jgi:hypothetical protein
MSMSLRGVGADSRLARVRLLLRFARVADTGMRTAKSQVDRDLATDQYCRAVDALVAELGALEDAGDLALAFPAAAS